MGASRSSTVQATDANAAAETIQTAAKAPPAP
jgi:hypothetical protein